MYRGPFKLACGGAGRCNPREPTALIVNGLCEDINCKMLIDTGCSVSLVSQNFMSKSSITNCQVKLETINGSYIFTKGMCRFESIIINNVHIGPSNMHIIHSTPLGVDMIIGLDIILEHGLNILGRGTKEKMIIKPNSISGIISEYVYHANSTDSVLCQPNSHFLIIW